MEDAHTHLLAVPDDKEACFFAVYDGHGGKPVKIFLKSKQNLAFLGAKVAQYAGNHLHKKIIQSDAYGKNN